MSNEQLALHNKYGGGCPGAVKLLRKKIGGLSNKRAYRML